MRKVSKLSSLVALALGGALPASQAGDHQLEQTLDGITQEMAVTNIYRAYFPNEDIARKTAISFHSNLLESHLSEGYLILELSEEEMAKLKPFGYKFEQAQAFIKQRDQRLLRLQQQMLEKKQVLTDKPQASQALPEIQSIPGYSCYQTVEETFTQAEAMVSSNANLAELIDVGDSWMKTQNQGGYDIRVLKLTNKNTGGDKPILFINTAIHAREYTTAPLIMEFANWLLDGYGTNADATWLLDAHEIHWMLHTNPDGRKRAETGLSWRKNTNENYCGSTSNSRGADLNRNFTFSWNSTNGQGSSGNQCSDTYRGPTAGSEPEIQALENYVRSIFPDRRGTGSNDAAPSDTQGIHLDIHSYSELILWPWGDTNQSAPNGTALQTLGRKLADFNGYMPQQSIGLYPTDGTSDSVSYGELGVAAFTFELGTSFFQSCSTFENTIVPDNLPALVYAAKVVGAPYITPGGPDITALTINGSSNSGTIPPNSSGTLAATASDDRFSSRNGSESTQNISAIEYYLDTPPWANGATAISLSASDGSFNSKTESGDVSIDTTGLAAGQHTVYLRAQDVGGTWGAVSAMFLQVSDDVVIPDNQLENGVAKTGLSGAKSSDTYFTMQVPADANSLNFVMTGGTGDADLYVKYNADPASSPDCRPYKNGNEETCTISNIQSGIYQVMLRGYSAYSGVSLTGTYTTGTVSGYENTTDVAIPDNSAAGASSTISVDRSGASGTVSVEVDIIHTYIGDLTVDLIAPDGSSYNLHNRSGSGSNNISQTYSVNVGSVDSQGTWTLKVVDNANIDTGNIDRWKISF
ncbi:M14 family zinc carboxypeptidase [Thalassomonas haliotis]|uniref:Proprotein convertase P-domain-containing protein n=1 Tax=Thalassomonas haliotis TaxID=485448 RepID=A0ABY7VGH9_9GAMM|nr:M14 family zinc carboxypeptidase [Thalassomonas haliotis]WDE12827.1 proprotein convertase P-domain-containing protein [Thalassomonas haliotis]